MTIKDLKASAIMVRPVLLQGEANRRDIALQLLTAASARCPLSMRRAGHRYAHRARTLSRRRSRQRFSPNDGRRDHEHRGSHGGEGYPTQRADETHDRPKHSSPADYRSGQTGRRGGTMRRAEILVEPELVVYWSSGVKVKTQKGQQHLLTHQGGTRNCQRTMQWIKQK